MRKKGEFFYSGIKWDMLGPLQAVELYHKAKNEKKMRKKRNC
jgi:hypothetical protein